MELTFLNNEINLKKKSSETENEFIFLQRLINKFQLILISLVSTDTSATGSLMWDEARELKENQPVQAGDRHTPLCTTTVDHVDRT